MSHELVIIQIKRFHTLFDCYMVSGKCSAKEHLAPQILLKWETILHFLTFITLHKILIPDIAIQNKIICYRNSTVS